jgi:iron complex outermembrane receptor protein
VLANVGDVTTNGVEFAVGWKPLPGLTWFSSVSYNDSSFDDDYTKETSTGPVVVAVKGKQVPDAPKTMLRSEVSYETGGAFFRVDGSYMAKRYYTYLNDGAAKSYVLFNASAGYRFGAVGGVFDDLTLQLDATNLFDKKYIATLNSNGFFETDTAGTAQTLLPGAPRQVFVSLKAKL